MYTYLNQLSAPLLIAPRFHGIILPTLACYWLTGHKLFTYYFTLSMERKIGASFDFDTNCVIS